MTPRPALIAAAAVLALSGCGSPVEQDAASAGSEVGADGLIAVGDRRPAPPLSGSTLDGERLDVGDRRGKVVVLNFWASWCPPCLAEAPNLNEVAQQTAAAGVTFLGVNIRDTRGQARAFSGREGVSYPSLYDPSGALLDRFRRIVPPFPPTTLVVDRRGRIARVFIGGITTAELLGPVQAAAAEPA